MQILDSEFEVRLVVLPRHTIHTGGGFALKRVERRPERIDTDVVEERGELLLLPLPCGSPYTAQRLGHASPALRPVRALLIRVPLGPRPWLHRLRHGSRRFVRRLPSYYDGVRLLGFVHHRLRLLTFPMRTRGVHPPAKSETSRFPCKERPHMPGSLTTPERQALALSHLPVLPSVLSITSASGPRTFRRSMAGLCVPLSTLRRHLRRCRRMTRGPVWFARPSLQETFTLYPLPVSPAH